MRDVAVPLMLFTTTTIMIFDPATLVLLVFAVLPGRALRWFFSPLVRWRWRLAWLVIPALLLLAELGPSDFVTWAAARAVLYLWLFACFAGVFGQDRSPTLRWSALLALAALWTAEPFLIFQQTFMLPVGQAHFWFIDLMNKLLLTGLAPILELLGVGGALPTILAYLNPSVALLSGHLVGLHFCLTAGVIWFLYSMLARQLSQLRGSPATLGPHLPRLWSLGALVAWCARGMESSPGLFTALCSVLLVGMTLGGAVIAWGLFARIRAGRALWLVLMVVGVFHPAWLTMPVMLAAGWAWFAPSNRAPVSPSSPPSWMGYWRLPLVAVMLLAWWLQPVLIETGAAHAHRPDVTRVTVPSPPTNRDGDLEVAVAASDGSAFWVDRFEHPGPRGVVPTTGLGPMEADARCRSQGKRLCSSQRWYEACSDGGRHFHMLKGIPYQRPVLNRLLSICNVKHPDRIHGVEPSGERRECRGRLHVQDLIGNAFEWVRVPGAHGMFGLAGSYHRYSDNQTMSCPFRILVHPSQLEIVDREAIGFRCCREFE